MGFSIIELLVAIAILSIVVLAVSALNLHMSRELSRSSTNFQIDVFRRNLLVLISDSASWTSTRLANRAGAAFPAGNMDCLTNGQPCTATNQRFAIHDGSGALFYDAIPNNNGIDRVGNTCDTYPSELCPFRYELRWSANCTPGNCVYPQVKVTAELSVAAGGKFVINTDLHSVPATFRAAQ